jgi:hypothetical protein
MPKLRLNLFTIIEQENLAFYYILRTSDATELRDSVKIIKEQENSTE